MKTIEKIYNLTILKNDHFFPKHKTPQMMLINGFIKNFRKIINKRLFLNNKGQEVG